MLGTGGRSVPEREWAEWNFSVMMLNNMHLHTGHFLGIQSLADNFLVKIIQ